jgi:phosphate transport system substrate-binding protein
MPINRARLGVAVTLALCGMPFRAEAQGVVICLRNGVQLNAERFEARGDTFSVFVAGNKAPVEYPASAIAGINIPCPASTASTPQPQPQTTAAATTTDQGRDGFGIHGSNTIGERLMPMLVEAYSQAQHGARPIVRLGAPEEQEITLGRATGPRSIVQLHAHGSGTAAKGLASGAAQIGMSSRPATEPEVQGIQATQRVDVRQPGNEHVLALDGLAVIVHPSNPVRQLTLDQIARISSGEFKNWSDVGGTSGPIKAHRRDDKSGTYDTFNSLVLAPRKFKPGAEVKAHESSESLSDEVFRDTGAIGFIGLPYINRNKALAIGDVCGLTSEPSTFTVKTEAYPLARRLFLYTLGEPRNAVARDLLRFSLSDDAQSIIKQAGFVEQSVELQPDAQFQSWLQSIAASPDAFLPKGKELPAGAKAALASTAANARRTTLTLRFERGSAELDVRARQDVARFARYLNSPELQGKRFFVVGFADSDGSWPTNVRLSNQRAASVAQALQQANLTVRPEQVVSMSYQAPVACNETDDGRRKNRRVEIWIAN